VSTRAKFYVSGLTLLPGKDSGITLNLSAVGRGDRNAAWASATPVGYISMTIQNPPAVKWWEDFMNASRQTGKQPELFVDIYPSEDGWPGDGHKFREGDFPKTHYGAGTCGECGLKEDADVTEYDYETRTNKVVGKAHPNG